MKRIKIDTTQAGSRINPGLHSHFIEFLGSCIYDGIWVGEDSSIPNVHGLRKDVLEGLRSIEPPVIRWPGGCFADTYHWKNGIGPRDERPVTYNENFSTYTLDSNQFGTHEFIELCDLVGAKAWLNVNMMTGSPAEMKEWMEYCNREESTSLTKERSKNGASKPFNVSYWGIGNEAWAGGGNATPESYMNEYRRYASAAPNFKSFIPGNEDKGMKLIAVGPDGNKPLERIAWTKGLFEAMSKFRQPPMYGLDLHFYNWNLIREEETETDFEVDDWYRVINSCLELEDIICEQYNLIQEGMKNYPEPEMLIPGLTFKSPECKLIVGEWGNWHRSSFMATPALYQQCTMRDAITTALTLDIFHRNSDKVEMACVAQSVNVLNALFLTDGPSFLKTPNYDVFKMYMVHRGAEAVPLEMEADRRLHTFASKKEGMIHINLINTDYDHEIELLLTFNGEVSFQDNTVLTYPDKHACNTFEEPDLIRAAKGQKPSLEEDGYRLTIPAGSVSVISFTTTSYR